MCTTGELTLPIDVLFESGVRLVSVHLRDGYVFFDNGYTLPITQMWDKDGEDVDVWEEAVACEFGNDEIGYGSVMMDPAEIRPSFH